MSNGDGRESITVAWRKIDPQSLGAIDEITITLHSSQTDLRTLIDYAQEMIQNIINYTRGE